MIQTPIVLLALFISTATPGQETASGGSAPGDLVYARPAQLVDAGGFRQRFCFGKNSQIKPLTTRYLVVHSICMATTSRSEARTLATADADKWEIQFRKGCLELAILAALSSGKLYGLEILRRLETTSNLIVSEGTIYPLLSRLKSEGVLDSEWVESEAGHPRKYYRLTPNGRRRAAAMAKMWSEFSSNLANLVSPLLREIR